MTRRNRLAAGTAETSPAKADNPAAGGVNGAGPATAAPGALGVLARLRRGEKVADSEWEAAVMAETATTLGKMLAEEASKRVAAERQAADMVQQAGAAHGRQAALTMAMGAILPVLDTLARAQAQGLQVQIDVVQLRVLIANGRMAMANANPVTLGQRQATEPEAPGNTA